MVTRYQQRRLTLRYMYSFRCLGHWVVWNRCKFDWQGAVFGLRRDAASQRVAPHATALNTFTICTCSHATALSTIYAWLAAIAVSAGRIAVALNACTIYASVLNACTIYAAALNACTIYAAARAQGDL